ncbi:MAG: hypothetical protein K0Q70_637 [Rhodospirillales bacterium]|jgi:hypothetical protein|nr:hypothetical protein [Rhodospirillales bacterium]MCE3257651.1 hypothetical protein [Nitrobacter vulgaris]
MNFTDPGEVVLTGQNPFMMLFANADGPPTTAVSFWRVQFSPAGAGHALFLRSEITDGKPRLYTDNPDVARYLQEELYANNPRPFGFFADAAIKPIPASFAQLGDARHFITETVATGAEIVTLTWQDFLPAYKGGMAANPETGAKHGHYALYIPARKVRLAINETCAKGEPRASKRDNFDTTSAALAWAETWVRPAKGGVQ